MTRHFTFRLSDIDQIADALCEAFDSPIVVFHGDIGSGKTTLIKSIVRSLGSSDPVSSPTFSIVNDYSLKNGSIYHFDLYRIKDTTEVLDIGFEEYLNSKQWLFIEWPEHVLDLLPSDANVIHIDVNNNKSRSLKLTINNKNLTENYAMNRY